MGIKRLKYLTGATLPSEFNCGLTRDEAAKFNSSILDLGDISADGEYFEALAAVFDLEGFTEFCNQIDPHLVVPEYLNEFLSWLFTSLDSELKSGE